MNGDIKLWVIFPLLAATALGGGFLARNWLLSKLKGWGFK